MPTKLLQKLMDGNQRYQSRFTLALRRSEIAAAQKPFAIVLGCVDSRVPPELIFDQGLGDLFVVRTAGQVLDRAALGSLQFGVEELHVPLLVVLGHTRCGAVKAALEVLEQDAHAGGDIQFLVQALEPAIELAMEAGGDPWDRAVRAQIGLLVAQLKQAPILAEAVASGALQIVGALYDLETGLVEIMEE